MALPDGKWPALNSEEWLTRGRELCAVAPRDPVVADGDVNVHSSSVPPVPFADTYDVKKVETVKGIILTIGSVRVGESKEERVRLRIRVIDDDREVIVYAAPVIHEGQYALDLCPDKTVEVTGSAAKDGNQSVLVAGSIAADGKSVKLRDDEGHVTWAQK